MAESKQAALEQFGDRGRLAGLAELMSAGKENPHNIGPYHQEDTRPQQFAD